MPFVTIILKKCNFKPPFDPPLVFTNDENKFVNKMLKPRMAILTFLQPIQLPTGKFDSKLSSHAMVKLCLIPDRKYKNPILNSYKCCNYLAISISHEIVVRTW